MKPARKQIIVLFCWAGPTASSRLREKGRFDGYTDENQTLPTVSDAYVLAMPTDKGRESIIAALVACDLTEDHLKKLLMDKLEPYAVPVLFKLFLQ
jgi:hypothetical protein